MCSNSIRYSTVLGANSIPESAHGVQESVEEVEEGQEDFEHQDLDSRLAVKVFLDIGET